MAAHMVITNLMVQEQWDKVMLVLEILIRLMVLVVAVVPVKRGFNHPKVKVVLVVMDYKMISALVLMFGMLVVEEALFGTVVMVVLEAKVAVVMELVAHTPNLLVQLILAEVAVAVGKMTMVLAALE